MAKEDESRKPSGGLEKNLEAKTSDEPYLGSPSAVYAFSRHICQILRPTIKGSSAVGSGFLVGPDLVLTCYHVVEAVDTHELSCRFDVKRTELGKSTWGPTVGVSEILATSRYSQLESEDEYKLDSLEHPDTDELDYALLRLDQPLGLGPVEIQQSEIVPRRWVRLPRSPVDVGASQIYILQHPGGAEQQAARGPLSEPQPSSGTRLRYLANTENGSSGSPCFQWNREAKSKLVLVAMHNYGDPGWFGKNSGFNHGIPAHLIHQHIVAQYPALAQELANEPLSVVSHLPEKSRESNRIAEIENALLKAPPREALEHYLIEVEALLAGKPDSYEARKLEKLLRRAIAADRRDQQMKANPLGSGPSSLWPKRFAIAATLFIASLVAVVSVPKFYPALLCDLGLQQNCGSIENGSTGEGVGGRVTESIVSPPLISRQTNCSISGSAVLNETYGNLAKGEPLAVSLDITYSGKLGNQLAVGRLLVTHDPSGSTLEADVDFSNFGDNAFGGANDVIGINGSHVDGSIGMVTASAKAKPGIDLRGPTTAFAGTTPQTSEQWNRLQQRTLMLPAPGNPDAVTGAARIGPLSVSCQIVDPENEETDAIVLPITPYDSATLNMLYKKYATPVSAGDNHACAIRGGIVYCWGANDRGQLGHGNDVDSSSPIAVPNLGSIVQVSAGSGRFVGQPDSHTCALARAGGVSCWGAGTEGQLGHDKKIDAFSPVRVSGSTDSIQIAAGGQFTCSLLNTGRVQCWGANHSGQLGNGDTTNSAIPKPVLNITNAVQISAGKQHACALLDNGSIQCWGSNYAGQLGIGEDQNSGVSNSTQPVDVYRIDDAVWVRAAESHTCAISADQNVTCWGQNAFGALGNGSEENGLTPINTQPRLFASQVDGGNSHSCAIVSDGSVHCWGANNGKFGNGLRDGSPHPVKAFSMDAKLRWIDSGESFTCGSTAENQIYCWGQTNANGNLGNGSVSDSLVPVRVATF